ncbi:hypothetical protein K144316041_20370 [Clostridium tetani]|uniref:hypothetical protein n=1 Tax=Clostridium tetani TaxID=1513 RepID=UPI0029542444|nr:hypothetical protein [Clostridium tetani]BDR73329.1 hypothetical protein K144316041_20370 [Clostridium tetani]
MALDLIKQYLVGIGFQVDSNSVENAEEAIGQAEEKIKKFNKSSNEGFSNTNESMKDLFSLFKSAGNMGKLFPELNKPFNGLIRDIILIKKLYKDISKQPKFKKENNDTDSPFKILAESILKTKGKLSKLKRTSKETLKGVMKESELLSNNGGESIKKFSSKGVTSLVLVTASVVVLIKSIKKLFNSIGDLAQQDIGYEKLSRQMWTTKENARDIDSALKTLGVTMQDLWLSPTLLKQFNQLRKDSQQLKLPPEFKDNIKVIQGLRLEFKRLKQFGALAFQWIGHYILKYCAGPLAEIKRGIHKFNNGLLKSIPYIGKIIGSTIGIIIRLILTVGKVLSPIFSIISRLFNFVISIIDKIPGPLKKILKIIGVIGALILTGPVGAIILVLGLLDDLFTFFRGGKSVIGSVFGFFKEKGSSAIESICNKFKDLKGRFKDGMASIKDDWNSYWDKASKTLDKLKDKAKKVWGNIKEWSKGIWDKTKEFISPNIAEKVNIYNKDIAGSNTVPASYVNSNSTSKNETITNSNNKIDNTNTINIYGSEPKATANAISRNLTGINTRNLQGVF